MSGSDGIQDVFEMTSTQAGMLFQSLYDPGSGVYFQQYWGRLEGRLDPDAFRAAWQSVIDRHDMLRAQCHWEELDRPVLAIHALARPEWQLEDWSGAGHEAQEARLCDWLAADRVRGFDMASVPLMRFALVRLAPEAHIFVWSFHHLLLDGWCGALLVREVLDIYAGNAPKAPPPPFRAFAEWREAQDETAARDYWAGALAGIEGPTPLGIDRPETGAAGVVEHRFRLAEELTEQLEAVARRERLTLATLMQGAWALILSRYAGQEDVVFGTVLSGRPADLPAAEEMIGLFLQTIPVRVAVASDRALWAWLADLQSAQRQREAHGHAALPDIQRWSGLSASTALFESLLIVETYPELIETAVSRQGAALKLCETGVHERTNYPLTLKILPGATIEMCLAADAARIPADALPRLAGHLAQVLEAIAAGQAETLRDIDILTAEERAEIEALGEGPRPPSPRTALARLLTMAKQRPDATAVQIPGGAHLDYAKLMRRAGAIGAALRDHGIRRGDIVAVCQDRTPDLLATLIAAWRCGAAYLPLDPSYPAERIAYILEDAGAALAVVDHVGRDALSALTGLPVLMVAGCGGAGALPDQVWDADLAYVLYTSGSTGRPKGVPITHASLANFLDSMCREPGIGPEDRWLALTTVAFDIAALELVGPLVVGGTVVLAGTGAGLDGRALARLIAEHRISTMQVTPAGWRVLRDSGWKGAPDLRILSGGEALDSLLARDLMRLGAELWNLYGPTETTIWSAALRVRPEHLNGPKVPVGGPLAQTTLGLYDGAGRRVPIGVPGELWIGGAGLSPGYLHRPELTADRFVVSEGVRLYRTGDRMRLNTDGTFDFLGRLDDQVKLRGFRIELGEIEKQLEAHPAIGQAVAMVRGEGGSARLVAYLRPEGAAPAPAEIRAHLARSLPAYMIPAAFVPLERFPLTPNGKVDRKALPSPGGARPVTMSLSQRDEVVAGIWAEVLEVGHVAPGDDFFALGGHSLLALRVIGEVHRHLGADLALRDLFEALTLERFCARIDTGRARVALPAVRRSAVPVLSPAQHRQWLLSRLDPGGADYHLPLAVRLEGPLDAAALQRALSGLARRHAVLRCRFPADRGIARVEILPDAAVELRHDDLTDRLEGEGAAALQGIRADEAEAPFDMAAAPPWRARLVRFGVEDHVLLLTLHHILADEWSFGVMLKELSASYLGQADAAPPVVQYPDFSAWQRALDLDEQRGYWRRQLAGAPAVVDLPADRPRPERRDGYAGRVTVRVGAETAQALELLARQNGATLFICLLSAYAVFLARHSGDRDILIGTPVSNRRLPEFHDLVGLFVNTLAIRADLDGVPDFAAVLARVRETVLAAHANQDLPFEQVLELLGPPRSERHAPLVQTMFAMPSLPRRGELAPGLAWQALPGQGGRARFDLSLELSRTEQGIEGHLDYATDIFDAATAERLARRLETMLDGLAAAASQPLSELPLLTSADRARALPSIAATTGNGGPADWLEAHAANRPAAPALPDLELDYAGLSHRVLAGAAALQAAGIGPGVAVALDPVGSEAVLGILAVLRAGGAVVPLDPACEARDRIVATTGLRHALDPLALEGVQRLTLSTEALDATALPEAEGALILADDPALPALFDSGVFRHLAAVAGEIGSEARIATGASLSRVAGIAALAVAMRSGAELVFNGPADGIVVSTHHGARALRFGSLDTSGADVRSLPELPGACVSDAEGLRPAPGVRACLLDGDGQLVPPGSIGALAISGTGLARGYPGAPGLTAARFMPNPHADPRAFDAADACLFRTQFAARLDAEGRLVPVPPGAPRARLGGERRPPEEVEALFSTLPGVAAAALALPDGARIAERLDLFLEPDPDGDLPDEASLSRFASENLPESLVPRSIIWLDRLPRGTDGRPDRAALSRRARAERGGVPRGEVEETLARIWRDVLGIAESGRHDGFFELGGDSILAMQVTARAAEAGLAFEPRDLFRHQTVAALATVARPMDPAAAAPDALPALDDVDLDAVAELVSFGTD